MCDELNITKPSCHTCGNVQALVDKFNILWNCPDCTTQPGSGNRLMEYVSGSMARRKVVVGKITRYKEAPSSFVKTTEDK